MLKFAVWLLIAYLYHGILVLSLQKTPTVANPSTVLPAIRTIHTRSSSRFDANAKVHNVSSLLKNLTTTKTPNIQHPTSNILTKHPYEMMNHSGKQPVSTSFSSSSGDHSPPPIVCHKNTTKPTFNHHKSCYSSSDPLKCFHDPIFCELHFLSGDRDMLHKRPTYGEYSLLKHEHWFHVIQHGGIAFLFHPCTNQSEIEKMRHVASQCLHRYILAPYPKLTQEMPLALVSWGCYYIANAVRGSMMQAWIREHAYKGPASHVHTNGQYRVNLVKKSEVITDVKDIIVCPSNEQKSRFNAMVSTTPVPSMVNRFDHESIIKNRVMKLSKLKPGLQVIQTNVTVTKVKAGSAAWAAASLIFLCGILVGWLVYTRQYPCAGSGPEYKYNRVSDRDFESFECEPGESDFNMLKSNQKIMSAFRWKNLNSRCDKRTLAAVNSMVAIDEECPDDDDDGEEKETVYFSRR